jgi:hypothetical protein
MAAGEGSGTLRSRGAAVNAWDIKDDEWERTLRDL